MDRDEEESWEGAYSHSREITDELGAMMTTAEMTPEVRTKAWLRITKLAAEITVMASAHAILAVSE